MAVAVEGSGLLGWLREPRWGRPPTMLMLAGVTTAGTLSTHIIVPALPAAAFDLGVPRASIQLTVTLYLIGLALGQLLHGALSDRFGRRPVLLGGMAVYAAASLLGALAPNLAVLVIARVLQALGGCTGLVLGRAIVRDGSEPDKAAARLALLTMIMASVPALAPFIGSYVSVWFGWRAVFGLMAVLGVGIVLTVLLMFGETSAPRRSANAIRRMLADYARLLRSPAFCGYALGGASSTTSFYAFLAAAPFFFEQVMHLPPTDMGTCNLLLLLGAGTGSMLANRFAGKVGIGRSARTGNLFCLAGAVLLLTVDLAGIDGFWTITGAMLVFMLGVGASSPFASAGALSIYPDAAGTASGLHGCVQMGYGALATLAASAFHADSMLPVALILLGSAVLGQISFTVASRADIRRSE
jgi:DHA1 family bicyclomycin/chloramphenicol resistance-like MFS transporter